MIIPKTNLIDLWKWAIWYIWLSCSLESCKYTPLNSKYTDYEPHAKTKNEKIPFETPFKNFWWDYFLIEVKIYLKI